MKRLSKFNAVLLSLVLAVIAVLCGFFMTACDKDNVGGENGDNSNVNKPESKPLSLTSSVVTNDNGENVYTINAIVNPDTLTPRWAIVWENPDSEWASGKNVNDYISFELSNGDKTAKLSTKQAFGETAILTATIGQGASAVSVSKKMEYQARWNFSYSRYKDGYALMTCTFDSIATRYDYDMVIPSYYDGLPVVRIGGDSVSYFKLFTSGREVLQSLVIPDTVTSVAAEVFANCTSLKKVKVSANMSISSSLFKNCTSLASVILPSGVSSIFYSAFRGCTSLESITIPASVEEIYSGAFENCTSLNNVVFEGTDTKINVLGNSFNGCPYQP